MIQNTLADQTGKKNAYWKGYYHTPWGVFESAEAAKIASPFQMISCFINGWCKQNHHRWNKLKTLKDRGLPLEWHRKTREEVGFYFEKVR